MTIMVNGKASTLENIFDYSTNTFEGVLYGSISLGRNVSTILEEWNETGSTWYYHNGELVEFELVDWEV